MKFLLAPWRWDFISSADKKRGCVFCKVSKKVTPESLICYLGKEVFVILNKYPYNSGHLMVVPYAHMDSPEKLSIEISKEMWGLMNKAVGILKRNFNPDGFNVGMNIGGSAGAGVRGHIHLHIVPRWNGDSNFMGVLAGTKVVSYDIIKIHEIIKNEFNK